MARKTKNKGALGAVQNASASLKKRMQAIRKDMEKRRRISAKSKPRKKPAKRKTKKKNETHENIPVHLLNITSSLLPVGLGGVIAGLLYIAPYEQEGADLWAVNRLPSLVVLDRNGDEIAARGARYGEAVTVDELPDYVVKAFLATEDRRFYQHRGVDIRGTLRAFVANTRAGGVVEGGSTITQQLAKNLFLSPKQTYERKLKEALLAIWLEGRYEKDEILSLYLNRIYLGAGAYGIESAAKTYFGKSSRDVTLAEAVMLAGLPKAPSTLAPTQNLFGAADRAKEVLDNLI